MDLINSNENAELGSVIAALSACGVLDELQNQHVKGLCEKARSPLDIMLSNLGFVSEETLADFYSRHFDMPRISRTDHSAIDELAQQTNIEFLRANRVLPIALNSDHLTVAVVDPLDSNGTRGLEFVFGKETKRVVTTATEFDALFAGVASVEEKLGNADVGLDLESDAAKLKDIASAEPAIRLVNRLLTDAAKQRASDLHLELKERSALVRLRVDGVLADHRALSRQEALAAISRLKILADLDIAERRRPQDGRLSFPVAGQTIDLRLSTTPTIFGESAVIRLLAKPVNNLSLSDLGFSTVQCETLTEIVRRPNGIILLTGPTGSGKTTTLYGLLQILAEKERKILTIEDPVEYQIAGVSQTQINPAIGLTFGSALRSFLRHDPDAIMVGEMRDLETAQTAVQAALTGHLVLSTLHTNDAPSAVTRLLDMGVDDYLLASSLLAVVAQRLVRRKCTECLHMQKVESPCLECGGSGFRGRIAVGEILIIDDALRRKIKRGVAAAEIRQAAERQGFTTLLADGESKIRNGETTAEEVRRVLGG